MAIYDDIKTELGSLSSISLEDSGSVLDVIDNIKLLDSKVTASYSRGFGDEPDEVPYDIVAIRVMYTTGSYHCFDNWVYNKEQASYIEYAKGESS
jgi:hypothetical protein|tara:strand:+ start:119 stop:403 length:285 start_codon:yes stop_codon:yes gene_type:complete